ncbi:MAG: hypothetical protein WBV11_16170 [Salegentibacter sp.]
MNASAKHRFTGNEKSMEEFQLNTAAWKEELLQITEEAQFFRHFLAADIFEVSNPEAFQQLLLYSDRLESLREDCQELNTLVQNHRYDIDGMLECDDVGCEAFYFQEHEKLRLQLQAFYKLFQQLRSEVCKYTMPLLRQHPET